MKDFEVIPLSVIEGIKAELKERTPKLKSGKLDIGTQWFSLREALEIIDRKVNEVKHNAT